jgi:hypothetical protein
MFFTEAIFERISFSLATRLVSQFPVDASQRWSDVAVRVHRLEQL